MDQNSLKRSFPVILKDEETGDRVMLTEDGQKRMSENDDDEMHHAPEFDLPQDVEEPEDEMHDAEDSEIDSPEEMEEAEDVIQWLFSEDEEEDEIRGAVEAAQDLVSGEGVDLELAAKAAADEFDVDFESVLQGLKQDREREVEEESVDPMERWIAPTIEEDSQQEEKVSQDDDDSLQLSETQIRNLIQQEIRNLLG